MSMLKNFHIFKRNQYPESLIINRVVKSYLNNAQNSNTSTSHIDTSTIYFKLPFFLFLNLPNARYVCSIKIIVKILTSNYHFHLLRLET